MTRLVAVNAYLAGDELRKPPFPIHVVTQAFIAAGVAGMIFRVFVGTAYLCLVALAIAAIGDTLGWFDPEVKPGQVWCYGGNTDNPFRKKAQIRNTVLAVKDGYVQWSQQWDAHPDWEQQINSNRIRWFLIDSELCGEAKCAPSNCSSRLITSAKSFLLAPLFISTTAIPTDAVPDGKHLFRR